MSNEDDKPEPADDQLLWILSGICMFHAWHDGNKELAGMRELTFEEFCQLPMTLDMHMAMTTEHYLVKRQVETGVCKSTITKIKRNGAIGKSKTFFTLDAKAYDTVDQVYMAYMEKVCGVKS